MQWRRQTFSAAGAQLGHQNFDWGTFFTRKKLGLYALFPAFFLGEALSYSLLYIYLLRLLFRHCAFSSHNTKKYPSQKIKNAMEVRRLRWLTNLNYSSFK
jgi:hypothetical protein